MNTFFSESTGFYLYSSLLQGVLDMMQYLNQNVGALTTLFTAIVAFATLFYAALTGFLVIETIKIRKIQTEPKISINIKPRDEWINFIDLIIENIGAGPAFDIKLTLNGDIKNLSEIGKSLSQINIFKNGIKYLAPSQKIQFVCTDMAEDSDVKKGLVLTIGIEYKNVYGKILHGEFPLDFSQYLGIPQLGKPPIYEIEGHLKGIREDLHQLRKKLVP